MRPTFASAVQGRRLGLSHVGGTPSGSYAFADWWDDGPFVLPGDVCAQLRALTSRPRAGRFEAWRAEHFDVLAEDLSPALVDAVLDPLLWTNTQWWQLDVESWHLGLKRYTVGHRHDEHVDLGPHRQDVKIAASWQLSDPGDYEGGDLRLRIGGAVFDAPRTLGAGAVFPAWLPHLVEPITAGERWALIVTGAGPKPR